MPPPKRRCGLLLFPLDSNCCDQSRLPVAASNAQQPHFALGFGQDVELAHQRQRRTEEERSRLRQGACGPGRAAQVPDELAGADVVVAASRLHAEGCSPPGARRLTKPARPRITIRWTTAGMPGPIPGSKSSTPE